MTPGFKGLTYIEAYGGQYIDTGVLHTSASTSILRLEIDFEIAADHTPGSAGEGIFGTCTAEKTQAYYLTALPDNTLRANYYTQNYVFSDSAAQGRHYAEWAKRVITIGDESKTFSAYRLTNNYPLYLGAVNKAGALQGGGFVGRIYSCRIYRYASASSAEYTLERDFVPCLSVNGSVGMYDLCEGVFYPNIGSGSFGAGELLPSVPDPVTGLTASASNGAVSILWTASPDADGYRIYRSGSLAADTAECFFSEDGLLVYRQYEYTVVPYNELGEGVGVSVSVMIKGSGSYLSDLVFDRTRADVLAGNAKGTYNASDLNRVASAAAFVRSLLLPLGYITPEIPVKVWSVNEIFRASQIEAHHRAVVGQDVLRYAADKPKLPSSAAGLTFTDANNIEKFLYLCGRAAENIPESFIFSGEINGGEF